MARLTPKALQTYQILKANEGGKLRPHKMLNGKECYRLLDKRLNPVYNIDIIPITELKDRGLIKITGYDFKVSAKLGY